MELEVPDHLSSVTTKKPQYSSQYLLLKIFLTTLIIVFMTNNYSPPIYAAAAAATTTVPSKASLKFIKTSCNTTTYPSLCYKTLSPYASSIKTSSLKLIYTSLRVSIKAALDSSTVISRLAVQRGLTKIEAAAIKDCKENIRSTIDELKQSRDAMSSLGGGAAAADHQKEFQMDNAKTWASAAITDESTCLEGFSSGKKVNPVVNRKIRSTIKNVGQLTSISLSLITHLKY